MTTTMENTTYEEALAELEQIIAQLQQEQVSIDALSQQSERAAELILFCKNKLRDIATKLVTTEGKPNLSA